MTRRTSMCAGVAALVGVLSLSTLAAAQPDVNRENAQALYKAGNDARDAGDMSAAAAKYKVAYGLVATPVIGTALGKAQLATGQLIEARQTLLGVDRIPRKPEESSLTTAARAEASTLAAQIELRIPVATLRMHVAEGGPHPSLAIDAVGVPDIALNGPWKLNPGSHVAVAILGTVRTEAHFKLGEGDAQEVPLEYPAPRPLVVPLVVPAVSYVEPGNREVPPRTRSLGTAGYTALAVGGGGVAVTAVFGALALTDKSSLDAECKLGRTRCPGSAQPDINSLHTSSIASDIGLGVAAVGLGTVVVLLVVDWKRRSPTREQASVEPWVSVGGLGARGTF